MIFCPLIFRSLRTALPPISAGSAKVPAPATTSSSGGAGSSGSVVARRLAENPSVQVLLIEAGGSDEVPTVMDPAAWPANLGSATDWGFVAEPNPDLNGRAIPMSMGKVLGGGSSINVMVWARGHRSDWDFFAQGDRRSILGL